MRLSKRFVDFNKQLLFGEIGALMGTPLFPLITSHFTDDPAVVSFSAVIGGLAAGSIFWLVVRVYDERRRGLHWVRHLAGQIVWFSPAASVLGLLIYQPTLFLVARHLIKAGALVVHAVLASQALAFTLFLVAMNLYRLMISRTGKKRI
jgi:hypothetical protein